MIRNTYLSNIKKDIAAGSLNEALEKLIKYTTLLNNSRYQNDVFLLKSRLHRLEKEFNMGLLDVSFFQNSRSRLTDNLLSVINKLYKEEHKLTLKISEKDIGYKSVDKFKSFLQSVLGMTPVFKK